MASLARKYWPFGILAGILLWLLLFSYPYLRQRHAVAWAESKGATVHSVRPDWLSENLFPKAQEWLGSKRGGGFWARPFVHTQMLDLGESEITDDDLRRLADFVGLEILMLPETAITDAGLESLENCSKLKILFLHETGISDAGLVHLEGLANLTYVSVEATSVTGEGVKRLKKALPGCEIISDSPPPDRQEGHSPPPSRQSARKSGSQDDPFADDP